MKTFLYVIIKLERIFDMGKIFKRLGVLCVAAFLVVLSTGCGSSSNSIVGKWEYYNEATKSTQSDIYYTFNKDGSGSYTFYSQDIKFTYEDNGTKVILDKEGTTMKNEYEYSIKDDVLTIKDDLGSDVKYKRK